MPNVFPTSLESIRVKTLLYHKTMNDIVDQLNANKSDIKINKDAQFIQFYIDKEGLKAFNKMAELEGFECLVAFFGIDSKRGGKVTVSFLGADKNKHILKQHKQKYQTIDPKTLKIKMNNPEDGGDQYPPPAKNGVPPTQNPQDLRNFNLSSSPDQINKAFSII